MRKLLFMMFVGVLWIAMVIILPLAQAEMPVQAAAKKPDQTMENVSIQAAAKTSVEAGGKVYRHTASNASEQTGAKIPEEGTYLIDGESTNEKGSGKLGTDLYLYIEKEEEPAGNKKKTKGNSGSTQDTDKSSHSGMADGTGNASGNGEEGANITAVSIDPGNLPKTGDYGVDKMSLYIAALGFGAGYLILEECERRKYP